QVCRQIFSDGKTKHHCRACGGGAVMHKPVPERGWGEEQVRVCDRCFGKTSTVKAQPQPTCDLK
ncbi:unnamed protein product, partial [Pocillopora meandrina]